MMVFASVWIIFSLISLGHVDDVKDLQNEWISMSKSEQSMSRIKNIATLVTYYDDFFVPSGKLKARRKPRDNVTQSAYMKGYALKNPSDLTKTKFDDVISNNILHRDGIIKARESLKEQRKKRGVLHLYNMVSCATGCDPLGYIGYGCYCGFLGSGYPVDGIDRCCERHDRCYKHASCPILEYIIPYFWKCYYTHPICALDHAEYGGPGSCASRLCECDRILSECLSRYPCPSAKTFCRSSPFRLLHNALSIFP